jgi:dTDP-4-dehydrorhamnose 3,5-epimerase
MSARFDIFTRVIPGLVVLQRKPVHDERGMFERIFCSIELTGLIGDRRIVQINRSRTLARGTVRGLHFQHLPQAEVKIISCLQGEVFDVVVDLRAGSPTFLNWHGEILSADNHKSMFIPEGFAHGFQTLTKDCELLYLHTAPYHAEVEAGVNVQDTRLAIRWPLPLSGLSPRDLALPHLTDAFTGIALP